MKILFLGTGAADYDASHRDLPGYRRNASALVDGALLIDPGPCVPDALETFGARAEGIRYVINTHPHDDHFDEKTLAALEKNGAEFITFEDGETKRIGKYEITALAANHSVKTQHFIIDDGE